MATGEDSFEKKKVTTPKLKIDLPTIDTDSIGEILQKEYGDSKNEPIEYFYIQIRKRNCNKAWQEQAREILYQQIKMLPQEWKKVKPGNNWPAMFFGNFPKKHSQESEREREDRLNKEVRKYLKETVEKEFKAGYKEWCCSKEETYDKNDLPTIHIMITRCCLYTGPDDDYMEDMETMMDIQ